MKTFWYACVALFATFAQATDSPASIYNLAAELTNQAGQSHGLDVYRGQPVLITMFYGSCPMTCPLLIDTVRAVERTAPAEQRKNLRVLLISIDPQHDTPAALGKLAQDRRIDTSRWTLARTDEKTVRKIAALLNIQYRKLPDGGYNHTSLITLLTSDGDITIQSAALGKTDEALTTAIRDLGSRSESVSRR